MPDVAVTTEVILKLLPLAIEAFGAVSAEVMQLRAAAGLSDEDLLAHAEQTDQTTLDLIQQHLDELAAADKTAGATDATVAAAPATVTTVPILTGSGPLIHTAPASTPEAPAPAADAPTSAPILTPGGALIHGQN